MSKNDKNFFRLEKYLNVLNIDITNLTKTEMVAVVSERGIGKSWDAILNIAAKYSLTNKKQLVIMRNIKLETEKYAKDLAGMFPDRNIHIDDKLGIIYELPEGKSLRAGMNNKSNYKIGMVVSLKATKQAKGLGYENVNMILYDEFNEPPDSSKPFDVGVKEQYKKFMDISTSVMRDRNVFVLMLGNRNDINNEFFVKFGINKDFSNEDGDYIEQVVYEETGEVLVNWIEVQSGVYNKSGTKNTWWYKMSQLDDKLKGFYKGEYAGGRNSQVINYRRYVHPTFEFVANVILFGFRKLSLGRIKVEGKPTCYVLTDEWEHDKDKGSISLTNAGIINKNTAYANDLDRKDIYTSLIKLYRDDRLFFTSNDFLAEFIETVKYIDVRRFF